VRVLVTGSRLFGCHATVRIALAKAVEGQPGPHTLVHGGASGADRIAAGLAAKQGWVVEEHRADWGRECDPSCNHRGGWRTRDDGSSWCPAAGAVRNQAMVDRGANVGLAFFARGVSNAGTSDCVKRAGAAHIPIRRFTA
jgi:hypothetical protein